MKIMNKMVAGKRGIAMTEYLIILAIVAVASIAVVGLFGKQIKQAFTNTTSSMAGQNGQNNNNANQGAVKQDDMGTATSNTKSTDSGSSSP